MEKNIKNKKYQSKKVVEKKAVFSKELAEEANKLMVIFNLKTCGLRLNNNVFINIAVRSYINHLKEMTLREAILFLRKEIIDYSKGEDYE